jgi:hypothetical protein
MAQCTLEIWRSTVSSTWDRVLNFADLDYIRVIAPDEKSDSKGAASSSPSPEGASEPVPKRVRRGSVDEGTEVEMVAEESGSSDEDDLAEMEPEVHGHAGRRFREPLRFLQGKKAAEFRKHAITVGAAGPPALKYNSQ